MQGVPRFGLRTRADYDLLQVLAIQGELRPHDAATLKRHWEGLLSGRFSYQRDRELVGDEPADGEMPDYLVITTREDDGEDGAERRVQMVRVESLSAEIFRLGFTVQEVEQAISDLEAI